MLVEASKLIVSVVNLGSGPKLFGADFTLTDPKKHLFESMHVRASGWGGDPYGTFHLDAMKSKLYQFDADYRDLTYFNNLPSYADPLITRGIILNEHRSTRAGTLELIPWNCCLVTGSFRISPMIATRAPEPE